MTVLIADLRICLLLVSFFGLCCVFVAWSRSIPAVAPSAVIGLVTGLLFLSDFLGVLRQASIGLFIVGLLGALHHFAVAWKNPVVYVNNLKLSTQTLLWCAVVFLFFILYGVNSSLEFHQWDEFSHWGTIIKALYESNTFHLNPNPLYFQDYPPGTALFAYFVLTIIGYSEGGAYFSYSLILMGYCIPIWTLASLRGYRPLCFTIAVTLVLVRLMGHGWYSVLIDHVLSVCFAGVFAAYLLYRRENASPWPLALLIITLVLAKHAGSSMALVLLGYIVLDSIVIVVSKFGLKQDFYTRVKSLIKQLCLLLLPLPAFCLSAIWNFYVETNELARGYGRFNLTELFQKGLRCCETAREQTIFTRYLDHWLGFPETLSHSLIVPLDFVGYIVSRIPHFSSIRWSSPMVTAVCIIAIGLVATIQSQPGVARRRQFIALSVLTFAGFLFGVVQLLFYLYAFPDYEALEIASFRRFDNTYKLAWALSTLALVILVTAASSETSVFNRFSRFKRSPLKLIINLLILLISVIALWIPKIDNAAREQRHTLRTWVTQLPLPLDKTRKVFIVWQGSNGFEFWKMHHELMPFITNRDCYSLGAPHYPTDIWSCPWSESKLISEWTNYDYVLVSHGYANLYRNYPNLLPNLGAAVDRQLLRIDREGVGLNLIPLQ